MAKNEPGLSNKSIVFIGFMGVGKTSVAKVIADTLDQPFIDTDEAIEQAFNMPTTQIFQELGEAAFRAKEKELITDLCIQKGNILSLGGGAFLQKEIRDICMSASNVVFLEISWEAWKERLNLLIDSRPVLQHKSINEIKELFFSRQEIYKSHHIKINTDGRHVEEVAAEVVKHLQGA